MLQLYLAISALLRIASCAPAKAISCQPMASMNTQFTDYTLADGLTLLPIQNGLTKPRHMVVDNMGNLLIVDSGRGVIVLTEAGDCWEQRLLISDPALNTGIQLTSDNVLLASSDDVLHRYSYDSHELTVSRPTTLVQGMTNTGHMTRTLQLDTAEEYVYISRGSGPNIDPLALDIETGSAQIRRFRLSDPSLRTWMDGELVAWGLRNSVGMAMDPRNSQFLFQVENSADNIVSPTYGNVVDDNPAEELNMIDLNDMGRNYGYPNCFTVWQFPEDVDNPPSTGMQFSANESITDEFCQDAQNVVGARLPFLGHTAPLDIKFFTASDDCSTSSTSLPCEWSGDAFVTQHGSWNAPTAHGYAVVRVPWQQGGEGPVAASDSSSGYEPIFQGNLEACLNDGCARPAGLAMEPSGQRRMFVSSDSTGEIFVMGRNLVKPTDSAAGELNGVGTGLGLCVMFVIGLLL